MKAIAVLSEARTAATMLKPIRRRILAHLRQPDSATGIAIALGLPRQRVGYHIRELEKEELVTCVGERRKGNFIERLLQTAAERFVISGAALGTLAADPEAIRDRFSSDYLLAVAARTVEDVAELQRQASAAGKKLPTLTLETQIRFRSAEEQGEFTRELADFLASAGRKFHRPDSEFGRTFHFVVGGYPRRSLKDAIDDDQIEDRDTLD